MSDDQIKGVIAHEIMHCAMAHTVREGDRDHHKWNVACDYAINPVLIDSGFKLPEGLLDSPEYHGLTAEEIYSRLPDSDSKSNNSNGVGEVRKPSNSDGSVLSESDKRQMEQEWKIAMSQAAQTAKKAGKLPQSLERFISEIVDPKVNWLEVLRRFVDSYARNDYAMFPPNRRHVSQGLYLASARSEELGLICTVMDTSGSVDFETLNQFGSELQDIAYHYRSDIQVLYCDKEVHTPEYFPIDTEIKLHPSGGGGTDFRPPFEWVDGESQRPTCMVYFTDGQCNQFAPDPGYPVLWAIYGKWAKTNFDPPYGEVIVI